MVQLATAIPLGTDTQQVGGNPSGGIRPFGAHRLIISEGVATRALTQKESGAICAFDRAAGVVYTLPPPALGMEFTFVTTVSRTSNAHKILTSAGTEFLIGGVNLFIAASAVTLGATADGTTIRALSSNGTTTGGVIGGVFTVTGVSSTLWNITGLVSGSGALATPFATS